MGTWALEFDPGRTGSVYEFVNFNGDVFAFCHDGTGAGVWRRTPPNWTRTIQDVGRGAVWDGKLWWTRGDGPVYAANAISSSEDGITWTEDVNFGLGAYSYWSALGGDEDYLYAAMLSFHGIAGTTFYRRDKAGNWTATPPLYAELNHSYDIARYGDYIYWSAAATDVRRYETAWASEPTLNGQAAIFFTESDSGILYAAGDDGEIWRKTSGGWTRELNLGAPWFGRAICVGADGSLWAGLRNVGTGNSAVFTRIGGMWIQHSTAAGVQFHSAIVDADGTIFAGTNSCEFWVYTPDFNVSPAGGGLYPEALDCDGDGDALFVCLYNAAAQPILVKAPLPLVAAAMGNAIFNPGAGSAINVRCGNVGGQLAIAGLLSAGGNDSVQVSLDGGATWTDIAPNWADTAQPLLINPNDLDGVMVALAGAQDIMDTEDGGGTWTQRNAAVGYSPGAMAKLPEGDELVVGDDGANRIDYSPNRGQQLTDITGAFAGNCQALEVA